MLKKNKNPNINSSKFATRDVVVTVVIATRNNVHSLGCAIISVLQQSFCKFELIVIDDASTDNTPNILEIYKRLDSRIRIITNYKQLGRAGARNAGLEVAKGEFVCILDSDDIMMPDRLSFQIEFMNRNPSVGMIGSFAIFDVDGKFCLAQPPCSDIKIKKLLLGGQNSAIINSTICVRRNIFIQNGGYKYSLFSPIYNEDYITFRDLAKKTNFKNITYPSIIVNTNGIVDPEIMKNKLRGMLAYEFQTITSDLNLRRLLRLVLRVFFICIPNVFLSLIYKLRLQSMEAYEDSDFVIAIRNAIIIRRNDVEAIG